MKTKVASFFVNQNQNWDKLNHTREMCRTTDYFRCKKLCIHIAEMHSHELSTRCRFTKEKLEKGSFKRVSNSSKNRRLRTRLHSNV